MSDVDAVRWMASEHDLEFVDLDTYGVDPAAGEILPASLSRRHHVVAIKRKFGTPVIATADPDDLAAQETVRDSIGRDFISVVASRDQIGDYLDQLFGAIEESALTNGAELGEFSPSSSLKFDVEPSSSLVDEQEGIEGDENGSGAEAGFWFGPVDQSLPEGGGKHSPRLRKVLPTVGRVILSVGKMTLLASTMRNLPPKGLRPGSAAAGASKPSTSLGRGSSTLIRRWETIPLPR